MSAGCLIIAAPASGSGKTVITLGLLRALKQRGVPVSSFKIGPDYIDPAFHTAASERVCVNLDSWAMRLDTIAGLLDQQAQDSDVVIGEGVMGLFDGAPDGRGSSADLASLLVVPVLLVVDALRMGASAAAVVEGFLRHRADVGVAGIIFNRVAGEKHARILRRACDARFATPVLGCVPRLGAIELPARHLGLVQAEEHTNLHGFLDEAARLVAESIDLDHVLRLARPAALARMGAQPVPVPPLGQRIAVARDAAFGFTYSATLAGWRARGAEVLPFSPLADEAPARHADAVFLPGGYPELYAGRLSTNHRFLDGLRAHARHGNTVFGECGGYMVLGSRLIDGTGQSYAMADLLPAVTSFATRKLHLGYRRLRLCADGPLGTCGTTFAGHEFHYATDLSPGGIDPLCTVSDAEGVDLGASGMRVGTVLGSFMHLIDRAEPTGDRSG